MKSRYKEQTAPKNLFEVGLRDQLDQRHELYQLAEILPWGMFEEKFSPLYAEKGRPAKPIRRMVGLLYLKQLKNLSDEGICESWRESPYACQKMKKKLHSLQTPSTKATIGRLKGGFRMVPCWVKGAKGASVNVMMAAAAWNINKWILKLLFWLYAYLFAELMHNRQPASKAWLHPQPLPQNA